MSISTSAVSYLVKPENCTPFKLHLQLRATYLSNARITRSLASAHRVRPLGGSNFGLLKASVVSGSKLRKCLRPTRRLINCSPSLLLINHARDHLYQAAPGRTRKLVKSHTTHSFVFRCRSSGCQAESSIQCTNFLRPASSTEKGNEPVANQTMYRTCKENLPKTGRSISLSVMGGDVVDRDQTNYCSWCVPAVAANLPRSEANRHLVSKRMEVGKHQQGEKSFHTNTHVIWRRLG